MKEDISTLSQGPVIFCVPIPKKKFYVTNHSGLAEQSQKEVGFGEYPDIKCQVRRIQTGLSCDDFGKKNDSASYNH